MQDLLIAAAVAIVSGVVSGLVTYGGIRVTMQYMGRDIAEALSKANDADGKATRALILLEERTRHTNGVDKP